MKYINSIDEIDLKEYDYIPQIIMLSQCKDFANLKDISCFVPTYLDFNNVYCYSYDVIKYRDKHKYDNIADRDLYYQETMTAQPDANLIFLSFDKEHKVQIKVNKKTRINKYFLSTDDIFLDYVCYHAPNKTKFISSKINHFKKNETNDIAHSFMFIYNCNNENIIFLLNEHTFSNRVALNLNIFIKNEYEILSVNTKSYDNILKLIQQNINTKREQNELNKFLKIKELLDYDINDYLTGKDKLEELKNMYDKYKLSHIYKLYEFKFKPLFSYKDTSLYFSSKVYGSSQFFILKDKDKVTLCDSYNMPTEKIKFYQRIFDRLHTFYYSDYNNFYNPYTGEMLSDSYKVITKTAQYIQYRGGSYNENYHYLTLIDKKIYIEATREEIEKYERDLSILSSLEGE